ncbi:hypothetical protein MN116_004124 [Schistosoma mekongi]|uniref:Uncharacterized protein n=1 Tax=Schistosoma mekongi TaxID=38744 RepID=A0AAE1ZGD9_SCHME|nr:hypothetical protein MN116_004124 [Schistosoma mekongi]
MYDLSKFCGNILGLTGFIAVLQNVFVSSIWIVYLFSWHINRSNNLSNNQDVANKEELDPELSKYSLRFSTKVKIFIIVISSLAVHLSEGIRMSYLLISGIDIRNVYGKYFCRFHTFVHCVASCTSTWTFALLWLNKLFSLLVGWRYFWIVNSKITTFIQTSMLIIINILANYIFWSSGEFCNKYYYNKDFIYTWFILGLFLPKIISIISSILIIRIYNKHESEMNISYALITSSDMEVINITTRYMNRMYAVKLTLILEFRHQYTDAVDESQTDRNTRRRFHLSITIQLK